MIKKWGSGKRAASAASKVLKSGKSGKSSKVLAASALTQAERTKKVTRALATASKSTGAFESRYARKR